MSARGQANARHFAPLADARGRAGRSGRISQRHGTTRPGAADQPYLSVTEPVSCVTMSLALEIQERIHVLCAGLAGTSASPCRQPRKRSPHNPDSPYLAEFVRHATPWQQNPAQRRSNPTAQLLPG